MKKLLSILSIAFAVNTQAQCCYTTTYPTAAGWKMDGLYYSIGPSAFTFSATPCNASGNTSFSYATHPLACTLSDTAWTGDIDFIYTGRGSGGVSHSLLAVTADTANAWNTSALGSTNQNAIEAYISNPINGAQSTDSVFAHAKLGTTWMTASKGIALSENVTYYIRLERLNQTQGRISLFTDAARTIHAPGSPKTFPVSATVSGLAYVQHGAIPQGNHSRTLTGTLKNLNICSNAPTTSSTSCCYSTTYPSPTGWKTDGLYYTIGTSAFTFSATPCNASGSTSFSYATHALACTLSDSTWTGDVDFIYTGRGNGGVSHSLLAVTADTANAWNTSTLGSTNQNAIEAYIANPVNGVQSTDSIFAHAKLGTTWMTVSKGIALSENVTYYIRLERVSSTLGRINLFTDAARTMHAPGSPKTFPITAAVSGLSYVQHGAIPQGNYRRTLTGTLKNLSICDNVSNTTIGIAKNKTQNIDVNIYPNPNNGVFVIITATQQTLYMFDINGRLVLSKTINGTTTIDTNNIIDGVYNITLISNEGTVNKKVVILR